MENPLAYFAPVDPKVDFSALDEFVINFWEGDGTFEKSVDQRSVEKSYTFYDGPPFATGLPHYGHILTSVIKDLIPRFFTMNGYRVERRLGWDCHGVPAEYETEKELKLSGKKDIESLGIDKFNEACRSIVLRYTSEWQRVLTRIGRWVDFKHDYKTMDPDYMETVWWVFKKLWESGLIYQDYKVVHYSWRLSTPYSNFEATLDDAYREREDPAVVAQFELDDGGLILAWTTTPWTLPANMALAVNPEIMYCEIEFVDDGKHQRYILAKQQVDRWFAGKQTRLISEFLGKEIAGKTYQPLLPYFSHLKKDGAFKIIMGDFVTIEDGTGVVHIAPAFGEDDFYIAKRESVPLVNPVDDLGSFTSEVVEFSGINVFEANPLIISLLESKDKVFTHYKIKHQYPHDWRTDTPLIYRAIPSWYLRVTDIKDQMLVNNSKINWYPSHLRDGAFGNWLKNARDWAISRNRYWGTPIPIWICEKCGKHQAIGSIQELREASGNPLITDIHRHLIDPIQIACSGCGGVMRRVPEVLDCWFESGAMPYGQIHYPFENKEWFDENFPADFIVEYTGQMRGWFYTLIVLSTALFDKPPFENVIVHGVTLGEDGRKMSKRLRNYPDPDKVIQEFGADTLRMYLFDHPIIHAMDSRIERSGIVEMFRRFTLPLWNAFSFFVRYAEIDGWKPRREKYEPAPLDRWMISKVYDLCYEVHKAVNAYDIRSASELLVNFVDDLTNWYVRRSRDRFWKPEQDADKLSAYQTLYEVLVLYSQILAPFAPFLAEVIYKNLTGNESVHLVAWPLPDRNSIDDELNKKMGLIRQITSLGLSARAKAQLKVRQPLASIWIHTSEAFDEKDFALIANELNVKGVKYIQDVTDFAETFVRPDASKIGPMHGKDTPQIMAAARNGHFAVLADGRVKIADNEAWIFDADVINFYYQGKPGYACEAKGNLVVAIDIQLTDDLKLEGMARELIRHIQTIRKEAGFRLDDRIIVGIQATDQEIQRTILRYGEYIQSETLANEITSKMEEDWKIIREIDIDGKMVVVAVD